jgi:LacI family transcriptional regulator
MKKSTTTLKNIANQAGVSVPTVSRVLNGKSKHNRISKETQDLILKVAKELNYSPNQLARGLRLKRTNTLGYITPDISNPFFSGIARVVEKYARLQGYSIILCDSEENTDIEKESIQLLIDRKIDGLIISPVGQAVEHLKEVYNKNIPIVLIDRFFPDLDLPYVTSDNYKGALEATSYLIECGHIRIAYIQGLKNTSPNNERINGFKDAHKNFGIELDESLIVGNSFGEENGYLEMKLLLKRNNRPTAVFAGSNLISLGALKALAEESLKVPDDLSMISFDDQPYSKFLATPMTTVAQSGNQIGQLATKILIDIIETDKQFELKGILLPTNLIKRNSVKVIKNPELTEKIRATVITT